MSSSVRTWSQRRVSAVACILLLCLAGACTSLSRSLAGGMDRSPSAAREALRSGYDNSAAGRDAQRSPMADAAGEVV